MNNRQIEENRESYTKFAENFAKEIISQKPNEAHQFFALWLQNQISSDEFKESLENELWAANEAWEIEELIYPQEFSISYNSCSLANLKKTESWREPRKFPDELTDENFRQWMVIQFLPAEDDERIEFDAWFDFWFAVAEVNGELKIGYFEFAEPD